MRRNHSRKRNAFTLMELLLAMSILIIMGGLVTFAFMNIGQQATMDAALTQIRTLESSCNQFKLQHQRFPNSLDDLFQAPSGMTLRQWRGPFVNKPIKLDPWGNPYTYTKDELNNRVTITSNGPDGQANTLDDIPDPQANG